jgi:hypothetical protein
VRDADATDVHRPPTAACEETIQTVSASEFAEDQQRRRCEDAQAHKLALRTEWLRQTRLQAMVWGIQLAARANEGDGQVAVKNAQEIFEFLTKEDVH